jgi:2-polyprenyl-3-methyl-5-hydroxy-6-metoxy-1,4-benzoquinol methylase
VCNDLWKQFLKSEVENIGPRRLIYHLHYFLSPIYESEKYFPKEGQILELGCGEGMYSRYLRWCSGKRQITAIDFNEARIDAAKGKQISNITYLCMDGSDFDLDTDFDAIGLVHCLYLNSIDGQIEILKRCKKNLKPDGQLIIHALDVTRPGTELTMKLFFNLIKLIGRILGRTTTSSKLLIGIRQEGPWNWR